MPQGLSISYKSMEPRTCFWNANCRNGHPLLGDSLWLLPMLLSASAGAGVTYCSSTGGRQQQHGFKRTGLFLFYQNYSLCYLSAFKMLRTAYAKNRAILSDKCMCWLIRRKRLWPLKKTLTRFNLAFFQDVGDALAGALDGSSRQLLNVSQNLNEKILWVKTEMAETLNLATSQDTLCFFGVSLHFFTGHVNSFSGSQKSCIFSLFLSRKISARSTLLTRLTHD